MLSLFSDIPRLVENSSLRYFVHRRFVFSTAILGIIFARGALQAQTLPVGVVAGDDGNTSAYVALVFADGSTTVVSGLPTNLAFNFEAIAMNSSGVSFLGTTNNGIGYAALISSGGALTTLSGGGLSTAQQINAVALNNSRNGFIVGDGQSSQPYAAALNSGALTQISTGLPAQGTLAGCSINSSGAGMLGGTDTTDLGGFPTDYAASVTGTSVTTLTPATNYSAFNDTSINASGVGLFGGQNGSGNAYASLLTPPSTSLSSISGLPSGGNILSVAINAVGYGLVGGVDGSSNAYATIVQPGGGSLTAISGLPSNASIQAVALNDLGTGIIGGYAGVNAYAAFVTVEGGLTPITGVVSQLGEIYSVAITEQGTALIGGYSGADSTPYAVLVSPTGVLTSVSNLLTDPFASINSVAMRLVANHIWTGTNGALWNTNTNWNDSTVPQAGESATFAATNPPSTSGNHTVNVNASGMSVGNIYFSNPNGGGTAASYTIATQNAQNLTMNNLGSSATILVSGSNIAQNTISLPLVLQSNLSVTNNSSSNLTFSGAVSNGMSVSASLTHNAGTLVLSGANTYSGGTIINGGTIQIGLAGALPPSGNVTMSSGTLNIATGNQTIGNLTGTGGSVTIGSGVTLTAQGATGGLAFYGAITGSGALVKQGSGVLYLAGSNSYTGGTTVNAGSLALISALPTNQSLTINSPGYVSTSIEGSQTIGDLSGSGSLLIDYGTTLIAGTSTPNLTFSGPIIGGGAFTKQNSGTLVLSGVNTYLAGTTLTGGELQINRANALPSGGDVTISSGTLNITAGNQTIGNLSGTGGSIVIGSGLTLTVGATNLLLDTTFSGAISGGGALIKQNYATLTLAGDNTYLGGTTVNGGILQINTANSLPASGNVYIPDGTLIFSTSGPFIFSGSISRGGQVIQQGPGMVTFANVNTYSGETTISGGTLELTVANALPSGGSVEIDAGTLNLTAGNQTIGNLSGTGGSIALGSGTLLTVGTTASTNFAGGVSGLGALTKQGTGTLTLSGSSGSYSGSGGITINAGTILTGALNVLPATGNFFINPSGTLHVASANQVIGDLTNVSGQNGGISIDSGLTLTEGTSNSTTFYGVISGSGAFTKQGTGMLTLSAANTYLGGTTISNGIVLTSVPNTLPSGGNVTIGSSGTLQLGANQTMGTLSGNLSISGAVLMIGSGTAATAGDLLGIITITIGSNASLTVGTGNSTDFIGTIGGSGSFIKQNSGTLTLVDANNYSGGTTVNGGVLSIATTSALANGKVTLGASGTLQITATGSATIGDLAGSGFLQLPSGFTLTEGTSLSTNFSGSISGQGTFIKQGSGILTISGYSNNYTGGITISEGTLSVGSPPIANTYPVGTGSITIDAGGILALSPGVQLINNLVINGGTLSVPNSGTQVLQGSITGTSFSKTGTGILITNGNITMTSASTVSSGTLTVNGTFGGGGTIAVSSGATLKGTGTIAQSGSTSGSIQPGGSIGNLTFSANWTYASGSDLVIEMNTSTNSQHLQTSGTLTIDAGATVYVPADPGLYIFPFTREIVVAANTIDGIFSSATTSLPLVAVTVRTGDPSLWLDFTRLPATSLSFSGNAGAVAQCLDALIATPCSNLELVLDALSSTPTFDEIKQALLQMQPSEFTSLNVAEENALLYIQDAINNRLEHALKSGCSPRKLHLWIGAVGGHTSQKTRGEEPGFVANTPGAFLGFDAALGNRSFIGGGVGYTYTHLSWAGERGFANMNTAFAGIYGRWATPRVYVQSALLGGYNFYAVNRFIQFGPSNVINNRAKSSGEGGEGSFDLKAGMYFGDFRGSVVSPFASLDYTVVHRGDLNETGAESLNLKTHAQTADLLTSQLGVDVSHYFFDRCNAYNVFMKLSVIQESRFMGAHEKATLACGCTMDVKGYNPNRTLAGIGLGGNAAFSGNTLSLAWQGKINADYSDYSFHLQYNRGF